jgi:hypothetical protein
MVWILVAAAAFAGPVTSPPESQRSSASQWHALSAHAATASPTGLSGCAQVLGEPTTEKGFARALERVGPNTQCVDLKGRVAVLNPSISSTSGYGQSFLPWERLGPAPSTCGADLGPCIDPRGVLHVPSSAILTEVRPPTRIDRATRQAFRDAGLTEATVQVRIWVSPRGEYLGAEILEGPPAAHALALATVATWQFHPVVADGRPRDMRTDLALTFRVR